MILFYWFLQMTDPVFEAAVKALQINVDKIEEMIICTKQNCKASGALGGQYVETDDSDCRLTAKSWV